eukprot:m.93413 g.93413  ORF g.93413 m.93413 type:complete len:715 (+) comp12997_c2_seq3:219-2363(+)
MASNGDSPMTSAAHTVVTPTLSPTSTSEMDTTHVDASTDTTTPPPPPPPSSTTPASQATAIPDGNAAVYPGDQGDIGLSFDGAKPFTDDDCDGNTCDDEGTEQPSRSMSIASAPPLGRHSSILRDPRKRGSCCSRVSFKLPPSATTSRVSQRLGSVVRRKPPIPAIASGLLDHYRQICKAKSCPTLPCVEGWLEEIVAQRQDNLHTMRIHGVAVVSNAQLSSICGVFSASSKIKCIIMAGIGLTDEQIKFVCARLQFRKCLAKLDFAGNAFGEVGMNSIGHTLMLNKLLTYVNLSFTPLTLKMATVLQNVLPKSNVESLILHRCGLHDAKVLGAVTVGCTGCSTMTNISFKSNGMKGNCAKWLAALLRADLKLECLDLRSNQLGDEGACTLAQALETSTCVRKLVLFDNQIEERGARCLFQALASNSCVRDFDLSKNQVGQSSSMGYLKRALCFNTTLESLYLWSCGVGDDGLISIAEGLCENTTLLRLELRKNAIDTAGYLALSSALSSYNTVMYKLLLDPPMHASSHEETATTVYRKIQNRCAYNLTKRDLQANGYRAAPAVTYMSQEEDLAERERAAACARLFREGDVPQAEHGANFADSTATQSPSLAAQETGSDDSCGMETTQSEVQGEVEGNAVGDEEGAAKGAAKGAGSIPPTSPQKPPQAPTPAPPQAPMTPIPPRPSVSRSKLDGTKRKGVDRDGASSQAVSTDA